MSSSAFSDGSIMAAAAADDASWLLSSAHRRLSRSSDLSPVGVSSCAGFSGSAAYWTIKHGETMKLEGGGASSGVWRMIGWITAGVLGAGPVVLTGELVVMVIWCLCCLEKTALLGFLKVSRFFQVFLVPGHQKVMKHFYSSALTWKHHFSPNMETRAIFVLTSHLKQWF